mmetsp:Transcript_67945/g.153671  ORF Transcript_67945/g.153671 Transcript_67945/m.153671 type:complete len:219 (+) Transcript_67945:263-919(+)
MRLLVLGPLGVRAEEADGETLLASAARSTDPVDVVLDGEGEGVIDDQLHVLDVEAAARDVRGDQGCLLGGLEVCDGLRPLVLRHVALKGNDLVVALLPEEGLQPGGLLLVQAEDYNLLVRRVVLLEVVQQAIRLVLGVLDHLHLLADGGVGDHPLLDGADAHVHRRVQELRGQVVNGAGPGGAEHAGLALPRLRHAADDGLHDVDEAHVQHPVGLVQD